MGPKGRPDTQTNWSTDCRPQEELQLRVYYFWRGRTGDDSASSHLCTTTNYAWIERSGREVDYSFPSELYLHFPIRIPVVVLG
jgi:hypothetical protein